MLLSMWDKHSAASSNRPPAISSPVPTSTDSLKTGHPTVNSTQLFTYAMPVSPSNPLILYDLKQTAGPLTWSPSCFKAKLVLHYKQMPYTTIRLHGREARSTLAPMGFKPCWYDKKGRGVWTLPAIIDPPASTGGTPTTILDSRLIAEHLEKAYPKSPRVLPPPGEWLDRHDKIIGYLEKSVFPSLVRISQPGSKKVVDELDGKLSELRYRPIFFEGKPYAEAFTTPEERKRLWDSLKVGMDTLGSMIDDLARADGNKGPYIFGEKPMFVDIVLIAHFLWVSILPLDKDPGLAYAWDEIKKWNGGRWEKLVETFETQYGCQHPRLPAISYADSQQEIDSLAAQARL